MAEGYVFVCTECEKAIEAWIDGNPYILDENGEKEYVYHPDERSGQRVGNDYPNICLECAHLFTIDTQALIDKCPECESSKLVETFHIDGQPCPFCKKGKFVKDPDIFMIS